MLSAMSEMRVMLDGASGRVAIIGDFSASNELPGGFFTRFSDVVSAPPFFHPNAGPNIFVGASAFVKTMTGAMLRMGLIEAEKGQFADTLDEARALLRGDPPPPQQ